jgi:serine/threonine protein kinase
LIRYSRFTSECIGKEAGFLPYNNDANDIWALGIILINMITSRTPWGKALTTDDCFCDFLLHEDYLREMLPISEGANRIFRRIFVYEPSERITIPALRKAIVELNTFFMNDDEIARAGDSVRTAASYCGVHVQPIGRAAAVKATKVAPAAPPRTPAIKIADAIAAPPPTSAHQFVGGDLSEASEASSASDASLSAAESDGPATPSSYAQDPDLAIPELSIELSEPGPSLWKRIIGKNKPKGLGLVTTGAE